jgi:diaminopimelate decarboxylase
MKLSTLRRVINDLDEYQGPLLHYDLSQIERNARLLHNLENETECKYLYAVKASDYPDVLKLLSEYLSGFEVSNQHELEKLPTLKQGSVININSPIPHNYARFKFSSNKLIVIHNTDIYGHHTNKYITCSKYYHGLRIKHRELGLGAEAGLSDSRFGHSLKSLGRLGIHKDVCALHTHNGSENNSFEYYVSMLKYLLILQGRYFLNMRYVNLGGGLHSLSNEAIKNLAYTISPFSIENNVTILFEPGRYLFRAAGLQ